MFYLHTVFHHHLMLLSLSEVFKKELEKDVAGDTSGSFAKLLMALLQVASMLIVANCKKFVILSVKNVVLEQSGRM